MKSTTIYGRARNVVRIMATSKKPGAKKGEPKPLKRKLDQGFHKRLKTAMGDRDVPEVARAVGCTRAGLINLLKPGKPQIDALLLYELSDYLKVRPRWLLKGEGGKAPERAADEFLTWLDSAHDDERALVLGFIRARKAA
jgi:transcriptional regulator with XRE-family HTH domain